MPGRSGEPVCDWFDERRGGIRNAGWQWPSAHPMGHGLRQRGTVVLAGTKRRFWCSNGQWYQLTRLVPSVYHCETRDLARSSHLLGPCTLAADH
jgi:hypothetical protein